MKEHQIGETFWYHGKLYRVMKGEGCKGCAFMADNEKNCRRGDAEHCSMTCRNDHESVIFVEV
jgi:hypothetical protein